MTAWLICVLQARSAESGGDVSTITIPADAWREVLEQNRALRSQLESQQRQIDELRQRVDRFPIAAPFATDSSTDEMPSAPEPISRVEPNRRVILGGEAGVAFIAGEANTAFPNEEFRIDDARLFVEAEVARNVYVFTELELTSRESPDEFFRLGECYLEGADLPLPWSRDHTFTVRAGRLDVPFGEEYQRRGVTENPLISHSLSDLWGVDEGLAVFGRVDAWDYILAVQNGGNPTLRDYLGDKSVTARIGVRPGRGWRTSASVMRTGDLSSSNDRFSEIWIGNGFFRAIGSPATTTEFSAELAQLDLRYDWRGGHALGAIGRAWYDDNDTAADNRRQLEFGQFEAQQALAPKFYGALRYSRISADGAGYPIAGHGTFGRYFFSPNFTDRLWRLGLGLGYDPVENLRLKVEYSWERGRLASGQPRTETDQFAAEAGVKF
jgi:hypothetical protein